MGLVRDERELRNGSRHFGVCLVEFAIRGNESLPTPAGHLRPFDWDAHTLVYDRGVAPVGDAQDAGIRGRPEYPGLVSRQLLDILIVQKIVSGDQLALCAEEKQPLVLDCDGDAPFLERLDRRDPFFPEEIKLLRPGGEVCAVKGDECVFGGRTDQTAV